MPPAFFGVIQTFLVYVAIGKTMLVNFQQGQLARKPSDNYGSAVEAFKGYRIAD